MISVDMISVRGTGITKTFVTREFAFGRQLYTTFQPFAEH